MTDQFGWMLPLSSENDRFTKDLFRLDLLGHQSTGFLLRDIDYCPFQGHVGSGRSLGNAPPRKVQAVPRYLFIVVDLHIIGQNSEKLRAILREQPLDLCAEVRIFLQNIWHAEQNLKVARIRGLTGRMGKKPHAD